MTEKLLKADGSINEDTIEKIEKARPKTKICDLKLSDDEMQLLAKCLKTPINPSEFASFLKTSYSYACSTLNIWVYNGWVIKTLTRGRKTLYRLNTNNIEL